MSICRSSRSRQARNSACQSVRNRSLGRWTQRAFKRPTFTIFRGIPPSMYIHVHMHMGTPKANPTESGFGRLEAENSNTESISLATRTASFTITLRTLSPPATHHPLHQPIRRAAVAARYDPPLVKFVCASQTIATPPLFHQAEIFFCLAAYRGTSCRNCMAGPH